VSKKIVVIDLDGTLVSINSFHKWMIFIFKKSLITNRIDSCKIIYSILKRFVKLTTHKQMKYSILQISEKEIYLKYIDEFVEELSVYVNTKVMSYLDDTNNVTILATAAPLVYVELFSKKFKFDYTTATPLSSDENWFENIRGKKKETLNKVLLSIDKNHCDLVVSDHHDDIGIMELSKNILLVNPSEKSIALLEEKNIGFTIIV